jgi:hypothetical protein
MKMSVFWGVAQCSLVEVNQTTWHNTPEGSHLHTRCHENLKSHLHILYWYILLVWSFTVYLTL